MTTSYAFTGNIKDVVGAGATAVKANIGTNLGDLALVDLDALAIRLPERAPVTVASNGTFTTTLIATNSAGINIPDGALRYILYVSYRDAQGKRRDWNSGYFALTANTDLSAVVGTDVVVEVDAASAMVTSLVEQAVQDHTPGIELGYFQRASNFTTTNTSSSSTAGNITGMSVTIVGQGRPVDLRFHCCSVYHSVANTPVSAVIIRDGNLTGADNQIGGVISQSTTTGPSLMMTRRTNTLTLGVSYTFTVRVWSSAAGTATLVGAAYCPIELTITSR